MQTDRRGPVLETAGLQRAEIHVQTRPPTMAISRPLHRQMAVAITLRSQMVGAVTQIAETRPGIAPISHQRARVVRREVITRMLPRITPAVVAAAALMKRRRVLIRRRVGVILHQRGRIPHRPRPLAPIPLLAAVMAAEVEVGAAVAVEAPRMEVEVAVLHMVAEATLEAAADRTDTKQQSNSSSPSQIGAGFFFGSKLVSNLATLSRRRGLPKCVRDRAFPDWTSGKCLMERDSA